MPQPCHQSSLDSPDIRKGIPVSDPKEAVPQFYELFNPTLEALKELGGSASISELVEQIVDDLSLPDEVADVPHGDGSLSEVAYRAAWARTYLKKAGLLENSSRGVWALTPKGREIDGVDATSLVREVRRAQREKTHKRETEEEGLEEEVQDDWQEELLETLGKMDPIAFERLCQRLLRESGFIEVEVTRRSGDGGIDGHGLVRIGELISFPVLFQSKRYAGNIGPNVVRDFRGAMMGRADKGLIITTGGFTREAKREAKRDGAPPIDLIDGEGLTEKLKDLGLGVTVTERVVEDVEIRHDWFQSI